ncbi:mucoidy inhibitor MuiA family protein [Flavobacterium sp. HNIBRBA15423]|uniref:mucoidy inhibitor MuiA family protein n=1 Tax=Flavobacterium sp. HNIBRBA15423 TaxID=3458683 RepID=UPI004043EA1B
MKYQKIFLLQLTCLFLITSSLFSQNKTKKVTSKIEKVIVFSEGAQVTRKAKASFELGKTELVFQGISPKIDKQSLQVKGIGSFTILSVIHQNNFLNTQQHREEISSLEADKRNWELKKTTETNVLSILQNEENILAKNQVVGGTNSGLKTIDLKEAVDFHRQRLIDLVKKKTEVSQKISAIDSTLVKLDKQLKALNSSDESATSDIIVTVSANTAITDATFEINYYVFDAGWYSNYDLRVEDVNNPIDLLFKANIFQSSGEDWKDVKMVISSGNPTESGLAPTINPWYLNLNQRRASQSSVQAYGQLIGNTVSGTVSDTYGPIPGVSVIVKGTTIGTTTDFEGNYTIKVPSINSQLVFSYVGSQKIVNARNKVINVVLEPVAMEEVVVVAGYSSKKSKRNREEDDNDSSIPMETSVAYQPTTISYEIQVPYTVLSDGKVYTAEIKTFNLPAQYQYLSIPKIDASAYLTAKITDWQDLNLFDGELNLFFEGAYLGKSLLDLQNAADTLEISLGKDKGISIARKQMKEYKSKQFLSNYKTESRAFEISVKNNKPYPVEIIILDQLPISATKEITVDDEEYKEGTLAEETKIVTWKLNLPSKTEKKLNMKYKVKSPKNSSLILD